MDSQVHQELKIPLYHQIFMILRDKIHQGEYAEGALLPSEFEISQTYDVSRITAKRALNELAAAGLAIRERGRGTRVKLHGVGTQFHGSVQSLAKSLRERPGAKIRVLSFEYVPASTEIAAILGLEKGAVVQRVERTNDRNGKPHSYLTTYVPAAIGKAWSASDMERKPLITLLEEAGHAVVRGEQTVSAVLADSQVAQLLKVSAGGPLLKILRTTYDRKGRVVEHLVGLYPPDRYQFTMSLTRARNGTDLQ